MVVVTGRRTQHLDTDSYSYSVKCWVLKFSNVAPHIHTTYTNAIFLFIQRSRYGQQILFCWLFLHKHNCSCLYYFKLWWCARDSSMPQLIQLLFWTANTIKNLIPCGHISYKGNDATTRGEKRQWESLKSSCCLQLCSDAQLSPWNECGIGY